MGAALLKHGFDLVSGGTDSHLLLVDLRKKKLNGKNSTTSLEHANITCNKNGIPFDPLPPATSSGIRIGSPAGTTRGFGAAEFTQIGDMIAEVLDGLAQNPDDNGVVEKKVRAAVYELCQKFPIYPDM